MLNFSKEALADYFSKFIWDFKIGDNIFFNLNILLFLYKSKQQESRSAEVFNKPLIILLMAVIEAVFFDLVLRLDGSTSHFPSFISAKRAEIKARIDSQKTPISRGSAIRVVKNYKMKDFISLFQEFELFGARDLRIYDDLLKAAALRNRIHIHNYFRKFERDETSVFTSLRLSAIEVIFEHIITTMASLYPRPFDSGNRDGWLSVLTC